jgi:hypothetical protein
MSMPFATFFAQKKPAGETVFVGVPIGVAKKRVAKAVPPVVQKTTGANGTRPHPEVVAQEPSSGLSAITHMNMMAIEPKNLVALIVCPLVQASCFPSYRSRIRYAWDSVKQNLGHQETLFGQKWKELSQVR